MAAGLCREPEGAPARRHAGVHRQRRRGGGAGARGLRRPVADQAQLALEREHAPFTNPAEVYDALAWLANRALRRKRESHRRSLLRVDVQDEPAGGIDREVPRVVRDGWPTGRRGISARTSGRERQPRPAAHDPDRLRARRGRPPRDRGVHRPATSETGSRDEREGSCGTGVARRGQPGCGGRPVSGAIVAAVVARRVLVRMALDARTRQDTTLYRACPQ